MNNHKFEIIDNHEFGIIDTFEEGKCYCDYGPKDFNCIPVGDRYIGPIVRKYMFDFIGMKTYFIDSTEQGEGLFYCGVTIIPPESLKQFRDIIVKANNHYKSEQLELLI
ncbi:hypothetical protein M972_112665 [Acetivibrio thermocellus AD2]|uniref:Uncharacterized protein n=1 Tax=Acetivibrio thermocellus AD2 TaxID=1138384 RepID=A0AB36TJR8_ACETH|nr:hypothetical protein [Acetivibrio thermocellus]CDG36416.1 hypothetical protein CTHBC1_1793 [Acetivibrio thermocellus BC1]ADU75573.1 hypothetical protein Clo1313_2570 [Acetivibrio thermocellus DSM 1313]ALX09565.1 hypothetical protein AD2_02583 [Acetivibrio thermocellus AD2]ANV77337.1 hypothetical protein LQRI_2596 [Acetivibrio thermocellus DSM 2360]EIC04458.1 hypothetical protein YSBL_1874 [Acetivibrio thermocellus YS]